MFCMCDFDVSASQCLSVFDLTYCQGLALFSEFPDLSTILIARILKHVVHLHYWSVQTLARSNHPPRDPPF